MFYLYPAVSGRSSVLACHKPVGLELWHRPSQVRSLACGLPSILEAHTPADLKHKPWVTPSRFLRQRGTVGSTPLPPPIGSCRCSGPTPKPTSAKFNDDDDDDSPTTPDPLLQQPGPR